MRPMFTVRVTNPILWIGLFFLTLGLSGCAEVAPVGAVSGSATCKGKALTTGEILLSTPNYKQAAAGVLDKDGKFTLRKSLPVGTYQVAWVPPALVPNEHGDLSMTPIVYPVPQKRQNIETTDLTFELKEGKNTATFQF